MKKTIKFIAVILGLTLFTQCQSPEPMPVEPGVSKTLADYRKQHITDIIYTLHFDIPEKASDAIIGKDSICFNLSDNQQDLQIDFREKQNNIKTIRCNKQLVKYEFKNEHIVIPYKYLNKGKNIIAIDFIAGNTSLNRNDEFLYTLFVPDRARTVFPCFDQPNLKAKFRLKLTIPNSWTAVANGVEIAKQINENTTSYQFAITKQLPTYLFGFVAGKFQTITRQHKGKKHTMYYRENDAEKVANNTNAIFQQLFQSLDWMENYTGIKYPFAKYDFIAIPSFQYGGMEHVGATLYRASSLFLDKNPTQNQLLRRANLIAHETSHMWFGDLVTMRWFDQVWLKEVFANYLADKITNPYFPKINHQLKFLMAHYPSSYKVDRTCGSNPINQNLPNLKDAGSVYGRIIYHKSPIVMRMLEGITGNENFQKGLQKYLKKYSYGNASWEDLIAILDQTTTTDLKQWSSVWVDKAGRPTISSSITDKNGKIADFTINQKDNKGNNGKWNQNIELILGYKNGNKKFAVTTNQPAVKVSKAENLPLPDFVIANGNANGYGYFQLDEKSKAYLLKNCHKIDNDLLRGVTWINLYENLYEGNINGSGFVDAIIQQLPKEQNTLVFSAMLSYLKSAYWLFLDAEQRKKIAPKVENMLYAQLQKENNLGRKSSLLMSLSNIAVTSKMCGKLYHIWKNKTSIGKLKLSEQRTTTMACNLALQLPEKAKQIIATQIKRISNSDRKKRLQFIAPALSANQNVRDSFFNSLSDAKNREHEPWVSTALRYLNHPTRQKEALKYLPKSLELLEEVKFTGDIFFPYDWLNACYSGHQSTEAGNITRRFLKQHPDYPENLKLKILQNADFVLRKTKQ